MACLPAGEKISLDKLGPAVGECCAQQRRRLGGLPKAFDGECVAKVRERVAALAVLPLPHRGCAVNMRGTMPPERLTLPCCC